MSVASSVRSTLPRPLTRFLGRDSEIKLLCELILRNEVRLLTLTGPGGVGKTRLAIETAHRIAESTDCLARFVTLGPVTDPADALPVIAESLGAWNIGDEDLISKVALILENDPALLVLDNLEHVIEIAVEIAELLAACPALTILATSRIPLHIQGEREYAVPQLEVPELNSIGSMLDLIANESVALFWDRALAVNPRFVLDDSNAEVIAAICARLDGLPLAIELAAARVKSLPPETLLNLLDNQLGLLRSDARDLPDRLRTIRAAIEWSYRLLDRSEQLSLRRLAVFAGDFSLESAAAVLGIESWEAIDVLSSLVDNSLLLSRRPFDDQPYYRMLSVVREFGRERLVEGDELHDVRFLHATWYAELCERNYEGQFGREQGHVLDFLDVNHENIRLALNWAFEQKDWVLAARIAGNIWQYWDVRGYLKEGRRWLSQLIEQNVDYPGALRSRLYYGWAILAGSDQDGARNLETGRELAAEAAQSGDRRLLATAYMLQSLGRDPESAIEGGQKAIIIWRELEEPIWVGIAQRIISGWAREIGDLDMAESYAHASHATLLQAGHIWEIAIAISTIGRVHQLRGDLEEAAKWYREGLRLDREVGDRIVVLRFSEFMLEIAATRRSYDRAVRLASGAQRLRELIDFGLRFPTEQAAIARTLDTARQALGDEQFNANWDLGRRYTINELIDESIAVTETEAKEQTASPHSATLVAGGLTRREQEVLRHIVAGETDQQIADELYVSYRTVTTHVTNILNKLGANSRTEAAAIAVRRGLTEDMD